MRSQSFDLNHPRFHSLAIGLFILAITLGCTSRESTTGKNRMESGTFEKNVNFKSKMNSTRRGSINTFSCGRVYLQNRSNLPLLATVEKNLLEKLRALSWTKEVTLIPSDQKPKPGEAAPDLFLFLDAKNFDAPKTTEPNKTSFSGTFTLNGGTNSLVKKLSSYTDHLSPIGTQLGIDIEANLECQFKGTIAKTDFYDRVAETAATSLTKSIDDYVKKELEMGVPFPDLPAAFYPAYESPPALPECIAELKPQLILSDRGYMLPCRTYWTFKSSKPHNELLESIAQTMKSTNWTVPLLGKNSLRYNLRMTNKEDILEIFMDYDDEQKARNLAYRKKYPPKTVLPKDEKKVIKIDQRSFQGDKVVLSEADQKKIIESIKNVRHGQPAENSIDEKPSEITYYVEYRNRMNQAEIDQAIETILKPETPVETLLLLSPVMNNKKIKDKWNKLLENSHPCHPKALLAIANNYKSSNKEKAKEMLHRIWVTNHAGVKRDADVTGEIKKLAKKLGMESKYKNKRNFDEDDLPVFKSLGFLRLPFETVPKKLAISPKQPVGFFGLDKDGEIFTILLQMVSESGQSGRYHLMHSQTNKHTRSHTSPYAGAFHLKDPISDKFYSLDLKKSGASIKGDEPKYYLEVTAL